jgi:hypothetical protein
MMRIPLLIVTKSSTDGEIRKGDKVWYSLNGDLNIVQDGGWIDSNDLTSETTDFEYKESEKQEVLIYGRTEQIVDI